MSKTLKIALDAMGGDYAPENEIQGAIKSYKENQDLDLEYVFVGKEDLIKSTLSKYDLGNMKYSIFHADEVVTMKDDPTIALKKKKNSSLYQGLMLHSDSKVDAFISAGNTGAVLSTSTILLGRIKGVSRPTIGSFFPTKNSYPSLVLDVGANVDCKPQFLYEFAVMGSIYAKEILNIQDPKIALVNIGEESSKGDAASQAAYKLLSESNLNFVGNLEGRDILPGQADVFVCDGFTGNIILKFAESFPSYLKHLIKNYAEKGLLRKIAVGLMVPVLRKVLSQLNYEEYGGVPLLGVNGNVIIGHGGSSPKAISAMISRAVENIQNDINGKIKIALNSPNISK